MLSIIAPVGAFVTLKLTGILPGPIMISEIVTAGTISWEMEQPSMHTSIGQILNHSYSAEGIEVLHSIMIWDSDGGTTRLSVNVSACFVTGYFVNASLELRGDMFSAALIASVYSLDNCSITDRADWGYTWNYVNGSKAHLDVQGSGRPQQVSLRVAFDWLQAKIERESHDLQVRCGVTYFNGSTFDKVVFPTALRWLCDQAGDTFESTKTVVFGNYTGYVSYDGDMWDCYRIWLEKGQTARIGLMGTFRLAYHIYDLYLYDPNKNSVANSTEVVPLPRELLVTANQTGYWYIGVKPYCCYGYYLLSIEAS